MNSRHRKSRGFTLVELLVVIGIMATLMGILLPSIARAVEQSKRIKCMSNLRSLGQAMVAYATVHKDRLPNCNPPLVSRDYDGANAALIALYEGYARTAEVFHCPSDQDPPTTTIVTADYELPNSARVSYEFYSISWMPEYGPRLPQVMGAPLAWDLSGGKPEFDIQQNHGIKGGNVVFGDGHTEWQPQREWDGENWAKPADKYYPKTP